MPPKTKKKATKGKTKRKTTSKRPAKKRPIKKPTKRKPTKKQTKPVRKSNRVALQHKREPQCKEIENLYGPIELDILDNSQTGTRIVLLGDMHVNEQKCAPDIRCGVPIWKYLENVFKQFRSRDKEDYLDFFLEIDFAETQRFKIEQNLKVARGSIRYKLRTQDEPIQDFLTSIRLYFVNCLQRVKEQCEFHGKRIRFHYSDVREGAIHKQMDEYDKAIVRQLQEIMTIRNEPEKVKQHHVKQLLTFLDKFQSKDIDYFFRLTKIDKQLKRIPDKRIVSSFYEYMEKHIESEIEKNDVFNYKHWGKQMLENVQKGKAPTTDSGIWTFSRLAFAIVADIFTPLFDIYTLARMIRLNMKRVIIYAGAFHTRAMKKFLVDNLGFQETISRKSNVRENSDSFQCISLKGVPQPWFP